MSDFTVTCDGCKNVLNGHFLSPATFTCQICGMDHGIIRLNDSSLGNTIIFQCIKCEGQFILKTGISSQLKCVGKKCGFSILIPQNPIILSRITSESEQSPPKFDLLPARKLEQSSPLLVRLVIPYYKGGPRIERAIKTWIHPEVVFALTDNGILPPGYGVCSQIFTPKNALSEKIGKKTQPFIIDLLVRLLENFPNHQYYGFFNSDIILPFGTPIKSLLPRKGKKIVFHHRLNLHGKDKDEIRDLKQQQQVYCGKDGFIAEKEVVQEMVAGVKDMIIGGAAWDDGLAVWCFKKYTPEKVDLRYGEVYHVTHPQVWNGDDPESKYNYCRLTESGVHESVRTSYNWFKMMEEETEEQKAKRLKVIGFIQPGRIGDIVIVLPIAKYYHDLGYRVVWPVVSEFMSLFDYVTYVDAVAIGEGTAGFYQRAHKKLQDMGIENILDLGIGLGRDETDWIATKLSFDEWKYYQAKVPFEERFNLQINRNFQKELDLQKELGILYDEKLEEGYVVTHSEGTKGKVDFKQSNSIEIRPIDDYTIFDWIGVIEKAKWVYCVDSCAAHVVNQLGLAKGHRTFQPLKDYFNRPGPIPKIDWSKEGITYKANPNRPKQTPSGDSLLVSLPGFHTGDWPLYPLGIGYLVSSLNRDRETSAIHFQKIEHADKLLPDILLKSKPGIVGFTCTTFNRGNVRKEIQRIRQLLPNVKIVVGGVHATYLPAQMLKNYGADYVVMGEGENSFRYLCRAIENGLDLSEIKGIAYLEEDGSVKINPPVDRIEDLSTLPSPDYTFVKQLIQDSEMGCIITSRGCPARCNYCSTSHYWGQKIRMLPIENVLSEIERLISLYGIKKLFFHDDTFNLTEARVKEICQGMIDRKFNLEWACHGRVHPVSQEMVDAMVEAGCRHVCWGIESGSKEMLQKMNKKINLIQVRAAYQLCEKHKDRLTTGAFTMVGYPGENEDTIAETCKFLDNISLTDSPSTAVLYVLPGTAVYDQLKDKITDDYWVESDEVFYNTTENSMVTLNGGVAKVDASGKKISFYVKKHFWDKILIGKVPVPKPPKYIGQKKTL